MGRVEEFWDKLLRDKFLAGERSTPFSIDDTQYLKLMGIDVNQSPTPVHHSEE